MNPTAFPTLSTARLLLRQIQPDDIAHIYAGLSHPDVIKYYGVSYDSLAATSIQMDWYTQLEQRGTGRWWAICAHDTQTFLGAVGFNDWHQEHRKAQIGYWLLPPYWGQGFMHEALVSVCNFGYQTMALHRIAASVEPANTASRRVLAHMGFQYEGTLRQCERKADGFLDLEIHAKLATD